MVETRQKNAVDYAGMAKGKQTVAQAANDTKQVKKKGNKGSDPNERVILNVNGSLEDQVELIKNSNPSEKTSHSSRMAEEEVQELDYSFTGSELDDEEMQALCAELAEVEQKKKQKEDAEKKRDEAREKKREELKAKLKQQIKNAKDKRTGKGE